MSNWTIILAFAAVVACALINLSLCKDGLDDRLNKAQHKSRNGGKVIDNLRGKNMEEVEEILKNAPNKHEYVWDAFYVSDLVKLSSLTVDLCEPDNIKGVGLMLSVRPEYLRRGLGGLVDYVEHYFKELIPKCVDNIDEYFEEISWSTRLAKRYKKRSITPDQESELVDECDDACELNIYIEIMNYYGEVISKDKKEQLLGDWAPYLYVCKLVREPCEQADIVKLNSA